MCGHGFVDMQAYADYFEGKLNDHYFIDEELTANLAEALQPALIFFHFKAANG
jgi:tryptophan synthase beta chain